MLVLSMSRCSRGSNTRMDQTPRGCVCVCVCVSGHAGRHTTLVPLVAPSLKFPPINFTRKLRFRNINYDNSESFDVTFSVCNGEEAQLSVCLAVACSSAPGDVQVQHGVGFVAPPQAICKSRMLG